MAVSSFDCAEMRVFESKNTNVLASGSVGHSALKAGELGGSLWQPQASASLAHEGWTLFCSGHLIGSISNSSVSFPAREADHQGS